MGPAQPVGVPFPPPLRARRRTLAIPPLLLDELERHYQRTTFKGDDERVFTSRTGGKWWVDRYGPAFKKASLPRE
ncbi:MAG: hypothetical protein ACJ74D_07640 [Gaiellaceae bacterium]|jgi:hypothetical protein